MTTLTLATVAVILFGMLNSQGYGRALALSGSTVAGAAIVAGSVAVPTFYAVAIGAAVAVVLRVVGGRLRPRPSPTPLPPGVALLLLFLAWSVLVTAIAPQLFDGQKVSVPGEGANAHLTAGVLTSSNFAQTVYLVLGIFVVIFLARARAAGPQLIGLAVGLTVLLSFWRYISQLGGVPFPEGVFDNSPFFVYIETAAGGLQRFRGILSEPSSLAASCLVAVSYMVSRASQITGPRRWGAWAVALIAGYLGTISTSASFIVAAVVVVLIAGLTFLVNFLSRRTFVSAFVSLLMCTLVVVALWVLPIVADFVQSVVDQKVTSSSFNERSGTNATSYELLLDTWGVGVGLGGNRASSFFAGLLSTTGIVGTLLLAAVIITLIRRSAPVVEYRPVVWALVTLLVLKIVSGPDLSDSSGVFWMSLGLLSRAVLVAESRRSAAKNTDRVAQVPSSVPDRSPGL